MPYSNFSGLTRTISPVADPVTIADAKMHSRIFVDLDDSLLAGYIAVATYNLELHCKRAFMPQTWRLSLEQFPGRSPSVGYRESTSPSEYFKYAYIQLPMPPLRAIRTFTYTDTAGTVFSMAQGLSNIVGNYVLDTDPEPGVVRLPFAGIWPTTILLPGSPIKITYDCGYDAFFGSLRVNSDGVATWSSGDRFTQDLRGTWINIGGSQLTVMRVTDATHLQLSASIYPLDTDVVFSANSVPSPLRQAILCLTAHLYENREPVIVGRSQTAIDVPRTIEAMVEKFRFRRTG